MSVITINLALKLKALPCVAQKVKSRALEDVVILNVDTNTMETPFDDLKKIPPDVVRFTLTSCLLLGPKDNV